MPKFNFYLRTTRSTKNDQPVPVKFVIRWNRQHLQYSTGETVQPKYWCEAKGQRNYQRAKETKAFPEFSDFNERLEFLLTKAKAAFRHFQTDHGRDPDPGELKAALDVATGRLQPTRNDLISYVEAFIDRSQGNVNPRSGKPYHSTYHGRNRITLKLLVEYLQIRRNGGRISFSAVDADFVDGFMKFLTSKKGLATNTVGKYLRALRMFVNAAAEEGYDIHPSFRSKRISIPEERTDKIYLDRCELQSLFDLTFPSNQSRLEHARDLFLLAAWTGLRFGDAAKLKPENIEANRIRIRMSKTGESVVIPLHPIVRAILDKYNGQLPSHISNQKLNKYIKECAQQSDLLQQPVAVSITKAGVRQEDAYPKWQLVTTHTARRSFASNLYLETKSSHSIMKITGHKTEKAFLRYLRLDGEQHADILANTALFKTPVLKVVNG